MKFQVNNFTLKKLEYYKLIKTRVSEDNNHLLWLRSKHEVSIVTFHDFSARHIHNFWNFKGAYANATSVIISSDAKKVAGIGFVRVSQSSVSQIQTIHVYDGGDGVSIFEANEIHPEVKAWICMEVSVDDDVIFLGAAGSNKFTEGDAFLFALTFDENAETVGEVRYGADKGFHCVNAIRRHTEGNILFVGKI